MFSTNDAGKFAELIKLSSSFDKPTLTLSGALNSNFDELILSDFWPTEVDASAIVNTPRRAIRRAKAIINSYGAMKETKFLDVGCGKGHCVVEASKQGATAWGYDITEQWEGPPESGALTTDFNVIKEKGPYDLVALYDVIDHVLDPEKCLSMLRDICSVCTANTTIRIRCHPWTSRHGGHLYLTLNKAYSHILLSDEALAKQKCEPVRKIARPLRDYKSLFDEGGFEIKSMNKISRPLERLFESPALVVAFKKKLNVDRNWQASVLPIEFIDYILKIK